MLVVQIQTKKLRAIIKEKIEENLVNRASQELSEIQMLYDWEVDTILDIVMADLSHNRHTVQHQTGKEIECNLYLLFGTICRSILNNYQAKEFEMAYFSQELFAALNKHAEVEPYL